MERNNIQNITLQQCAEVAGYLWQKGWAERNGGNLLASLDEAEALSIIEQAEALTHAHTIVPLEIAVPHLRGRYFYSKGTGCRMRTLAHSPMTQGCLLQISHDGSSYKLFNNDVHPTSEQAAHLLNHNQKAK